MTQAIADLPWHVDIRSNDKSKVETRYDKKDADEIARNAIVTADYVIVVQCKGRGCVCGAL